jgi:anti-anti-sigma factor
LDIIESKEGEVIVLAPKGSLNTQTSPKLEQKLQKLLSDKARLIVIDFKNVDYLSSAALRVLLMITRRLVRAHGRLVLCAMSDDLKKVFSISGFDRDFTILVSRGEAIELAAATPPPPAGAADTDAKGKKAKGGKAEAAPAAAKAEAEAPKPAAPAVAGWPFAQPGMKAAAPAPAAPAEPSVSEAPTEPPPPPPAPAPAPAARKTTAEEDTKDSPAPHLAVAGEILGRGETSPWASWGEAPHAAALAPRAAAILAKGL